MPTLYRQRSWKITMYFRDHPPPHFHVVTSSREEAQIAIRDLGLIAGRVPPRILATARAWAATHGSVLKNTWTEMHPGSGESDGR